MAPAEPAGKFTVNAPPVVLQKYPSPDDAVNVDVLIPPPVDPGEAPINIKNMKIMSIGVLIIEKSTVLKPAVLAVIE